MYSSHTPKFPPGASRRLLAAFVASALAHAWLVATLQGGSITRSGETRAASALAVLIETAPPVAPPAALEPAPEPIARDSIVRPAPRREAAVRSSERVIGQPRSQRSSATSSAPDPNYYPARALDVYPAPASPLDMPYPARARDARVEGRVELLVSIDEAGTVSEVSVVDAEPAGYFEDVARQTFLGTRFRPGERNGRAVKSRVVIRVSFGRDP